MTTRITGGEHRGRKLRSKQVPGLRPTTEKVRSAIFSKIGKTAVLGVRVLDLYAGSGAMGIEALSRGAEWVDFVERDNRLCSSIRHHLKEIRISSQAQVLNRNVDVSLDKLQMKYDLVFADPPYEDNPWKQLITKLQGNRLLNNGAILILEHHRDLKLVNSYGDVSLRQHRQHGETIISIYDYEQIDG